MEKLFFKKVELWVLLLVLLAGFVAMIGYGAVVRHVTGGGKSMGVVGTGAHALASIPSNFKDLLAGQKDFMSSIRASAFDIGDYEAIALDNAQRTPLRWINEAYADFLPVALMFRVSEERAEHLVIFDRERNVVREFPVTADSLSGRHPPLMGNSAPRLLDDATYIVHSHGSDGLYRKDLCGEIIWSTPGLYHHTFSMADGKIGILGLPEEDVSEAEQDLWNSSDVLNIIDVESGRIERSVPLVDIARANIGTIDPLVLHKWHRFVQDNGVLSKDLVHLNKLELLSDARAAEYPGLPAGAWMLSSRSLNLLFIVDPATLEIVWHAQGNTQAQHDPDFIGDNKIIVFNNNIAKNLPAKGDPANFSSIREFDFDTGQWRERYNAIEANGYTSHSGEVTAGNDENLLLVLTEQGRYLEVSGSGEVLSEFINVRDAESVYWTKSAQYLSDEQLEIARNIKCQ